MNDPWEEPEEYLLFDRGDGTFAIVLKEPLSVLLIEDELEEAKTIKRMLAAGVRIVKEFPGSS